MLATPTKRFCEIYNRAREQWGSGMSDDQVRDLAKEEFKTEQRTSFTYDHVWHVVKDEPKWYQSLPFCSKRTKTSASGDYSTSASNTTNTPTSVDDFVVNLEDDFEELPRPVGQKKTKARMKTKSKGKETPAPETMDQLNARLVQYMDQKQESMSSFQTQMSQFLFNQDMAVLMMNMSYMNEAQKRVHEDLCAKIKRKHNMD